MLDLDLAVAVRLIALPQCVVEPLEFDLGLANRLLACSQFEFARPQIALEAPLLGREVGVVRCAVGRLFIHGEHLGAGSDGASVFARSVATGQFIPPRSPRDFHDRLTTAAPKKRKTR
ncbi:hypothetical protein [Tahibacter soli]|uniref:Uncharacterized protein n=1 Tax=Tahibacter soli TaxID=2983605 RepID=A0A9X3YU04_9GAMM|nr:hypothetical protein [Tahibacter soli]MDC8016246.1 hypothetical protein [Tahibacter soli]